jgi:hypothetical protein
MLVNSLGQTVVKLRLGQVIYLGYGQAVAVFVSPAA